MKEKLLNLVKSNTFGLVVAIILSALAVIQEKVLGDASFGAIVLGIAVAYIVGVLAEAFKYVMHEGFSLSNTLWWLGGGVAGTALAWIVF